MVLPVNQTDFFLNTMLPFLNAEERCTASKVCKSWSAAARPFIQSDAAIMSLGRYWGYYQVRINLENKPEGHDYTYFRGLKWLTVEGASQKEEISAILQNMPSKCEEICIINCPKLTSLPEAKLFRRLRELQISNCPNLKNIDHLPKHLVVIIRV
ncbi:MAG TPA: hypothetical protein VLG76_03075 [Rhabdochlamydiaceae bacterium]|nr:hypothetical protein [Rhabdochlamydiaceae bacterium]